MSSKISLQGANNCQHLDLCFEPSPHAEEAEYRRPTARQRATATGKTKNGATGVSNSTFPAPLLLPGDDLSLDPRYPPQSLRLWEKVRNEVTKTRNVIYVAGQPGTAANVGFDSDWKYPVADRNVNAVALPRHEDVANYLRAFYHGMQLKTLPAETFLFTSWEDERPKSERRSKRKVKSANPGLIGLATSIEKIGIRTRPSPDKNFQQLNLNDLLDAAISALPDDAYALLMIVNHDLYEDEDDDFCCGRAYGGSRVAVVSTARYNPMLDEEQNVEREHAWPASHCKAYIQQCCGAGSGPVRSAGNKARKPTSVMGVDDNHSQQSPLQAAVSTSRDLLSSSAVRQQESTWLSKLWLSRVCQTASHELGHCFGMGHCVYYACVMQGTASLAEDVRQPPYLCPVDLARLLRATGADEKERYEAILGFCEEWQGTPMFAALGSWIRHAIGGLDGMGGSEEN